MVMNDGGGNLLDNFQVPFQRYAEGSADLP